MKGLKLILIVMLAIKALKTETVEEFEDISAKSLEEPAREDAAKSLESAENPDDVEGRKLKPIELYTNDERCNAIGVCSDMDYSDKDVIVTFSDKVAITFTNATTYILDEPKNFFSLAFVNSKFANFPLNLFLSFKTLELDFRNCSLETLKWDNFLSSGNLTILLLSENLLEEIKPSLFSLAENLSFLFLDANRITTLHSDSFKGLQKLNFLDLHKNFIETLPSGLFQHLTSLQQINLAQNCIKLIENSLFEHNPRLFSINLQQNNLIDIQDYAFQEQNNLKYLDVSHNPDLKTFVAGNVRVENLWAKNCSIYRVNIYGEAVHVDLQNNQIKELYFSKPEYLETLRLKSNALEQISSLDLTTNLITLDLSNNPDLKTLPDLWQINSLERLDLSNTSLKQIPFNALASPNKLRSLNVSSNLLEEINPLNFKYLEKLTHFYINHNNWNCYNLRMLMDILIKPLQMSYNQDEYDDNFVGEYIHGIKCMYRVEPADDEFYVDSNGSQQTDDSSDQELSKMSGSLIEDYNQLKMGNTKEVAKLRNEMKTIVRFYENKFDLIFNKLNEMDMRLKQFERFNKTLWQQVSIAF